MASVRKPDFRSQILENNHNKPIVLAFPKWGLPFLCFRYCRRYEEFRNLIEILNFSCNIDSTENSDHILKISGLGEMFGYCFK